MIALTVFAVSAAAKTDPTTTIVGFVVAGVFTVIAAIISGIALVNSSRNGKKAEDRKTEVEEAKGHTDEWARLLTLAQAQADASERRADAAERRAVVSEEKVEKLTQRLDGYDEKFEDQDKKIAGALEQLEEAVKGREAAERNADAAERRAVAAEQRADAAERRADAAEQRASLSEHMQQLLLQALRTIVEWGRERRSKVPMPLLAPEIEAALQDAV